MEQYFRKYVEFRKQYQQLQRKGDNTKSQTLDLLCFINNQSHQHEIKNICIYNAYIYIIYSRVYTHSCFLCAEKLFQSVPEKDLSDH